MGVVLTEAATRSAVHDASALETVELPESATRQGNSR
jgi:hypothetical protein